MLGESTIELKGLDGRTSILVYGRAHEDPLRCHPLIPSWAGKGRSAVANPGGDDEQQNKRAGLVFLSDTEPGSSAGSAGEGTQVEVDGEQGGAADETKSTAAEETKSTAEVIESTAV